MQHKYNEFGHMERVSTSGKCQHQAAAIGDNECFSST